MYGFDVFFLWKTEMFIRYKQGLSLAFIHVMFNLRAQNRKKFFFVDRRKYLLKTFGYGIEIYFLVNGKQKFFRFYITTVERL